VAPPGRRDFIICGIPRSGTTLVAAALWQPPSVVTVMEPWDGMRLPPSELFRSLRAEIERTGALGRGKLDVPALVSEGQVRWWAEGSTAVPVDVSSGYLLGVKWPAYWRYLDLLPDTRFVVCLRHPLEVISSFKRTGGRLARGLEYDTAFNQRMNRELASATDDPAVRRVLLFDWVASRVLPHLERPNVLVVRYERWFEDPAAVMEEIGSFLGITLRPDRLVIQPPGGHHLSAEEVGLVAERCRAAEALGYRIG
jgi:hypothetical protein